MHRERLLWGCVLLGLLLAPDVGLSPLTAQVVNSTLVGTVTDSSGASVPNATVRVTGVSTGSVRTTTTTLAGTYNLTYLSPETYTVRIEAKGFKTSVRSNVELGVSTTVRVDATLTPGEVSETLTVSAESPLLQTEQADVGRSVATRSVVELPLLNRDVHSLATTLAGVAPPSGGSPGLNDPGGTTSFSANGVGTAANNTIMDGSENREVVLGATVYSPAPELVEEIRVTTSNYAAEFGRVGGANVNIVTRGGTNDFHLAAWEFNRVSKLAARNFFNTTGPKPLLVQNEFGGTVSGPVVKNKTFFLVAYRGIRSLNSTFSINTVPATPWLSGNFSAVPGLALYDPNSGNTDGTARTPIPNNTIPQSRFSQAAGIITPYFPQPNQAIAATTLGYTNNYGLNAGTQVHENSVDGRADHYFSDQTRMFGRLNRTWEAYHQDAVLGPTIGNGLQSDNATISAIANLTESFTPTLLSEYRLSFVRHNFNVIGIPTALNNQKLGILDPTPTDLSTTGIASFAINGFPAIGEPVNYPANYVTNIFSFTNTWNKVRGKHAIKWGGMVTRYREEQIQAQGNNMGPRGLFVFNPGTAQLKGGPGLGSFGSVANSFASFLLGAADQIGRTFMTTDPTNRQTEAAAFVQDTYQISRRLTLNIGLRYELFTTVKPRFAGGGGNYDYTTNTYLISGYGAVGMSAGVRGSPKNFEPRVGFAYRLDNRSVLRGGFGLSKYQDRFGATGGTICCQFPAIGDIQNGVVNDYIVAGPVTSIPAIQTIPIPGSGVLDPAPDRPFYSMPFHYPNPYYMNYNLTYERELPRQLVWNIAYVGNLGRQGFYNGRPDASPPGTGVAGNPILARFGHASTVTLRADGLNSNYNALQTTVSKRFSQGLTFAVAYAFSKSLGYFTTPNQLNYSRNYGPNNYYPNLLTINHQYELPFGKGKRLVNKGGPLGYAVSGWQVNGIFRYASGVAVSTSADATSLNGPGNSQVADVVGPVQYLGGIGAASPWFSTSAFASPAPGRFGTAGIGILHAPSMRSYNFSVFRRFDLVERLKLEYRAEFYNLTNTPFFGSPNANVNSSAFGTITSASNSRQIQMALRFIY